MNLRILLLVALSVLSILSGCSQVSEAESELDPTDGIVSSEEIEMIYNRTKSFPDNTQLSLAIIKNGDVSFYGIKREEGVLKQIDNSNSVFEIGSISKVFTSTLLAHIVKSDSLELDSYINDHLDVSFKEDIKLSFKSLANHTSGLPRLPSNLNLFKVDQSNPYKDYDGIMLESYLKDELSLSENPGSKSEYSNLGVGLLGYTLSKMNASSYEELLNDKILSPLEMNQTTSTRSNVKSELVTGRDANGNEVSNWDFKSLAGAGAILSSVADLSIFALSQLDKTNEVYNLTKVETFKINDNMGIGLGWHIIYPKSGGKWYWHNGGTGGYTSSFAIDMERKNGVIILSNVSAFSKKMGEIDQLNFDIMRSMAK